MRKIIALTIAIPVTMLLFMIMPMLISVGTGAVPTTEMPDFVFARVQLEEQAETNDPDDPPEPPQGTEGLVKIEITSVTSSPTRPPIRSGVPGVIQSITPGGIDAPGLRDLRDCDHGPLMLTSPIHGYPPSAARAGLEGWVHVSFLVGIDGAVSDMTVVDAEPRHGFQRHALESVGRWRFRPAMVACEPVVARLEQRIDYTMDD